MPSVTTSIVVQFTTEGVSGVLTAELDSRDDGYNAGKTSFAPGEQPAFLIFKSANVEIDDIVSSAGSIGTLAGGTIEVEEFLTFANATEATLSKPITGALTHQWLGNNLGVPEVVGDMKIVVPTQGVGVLKVNYNSTFDARQLSGIATTLNGESEFTVLIVIIGTAS